MTPFVDIRDGQCRAPLSGSPGPAMMLCGEKALPGQSWCATCRPRLFYRPTNRELRGLDFKAGRPIQPLKVAGIAKR